jgi:hypothetical protein
MLITVNSPRIRTGIRVARDLRAQGITKANIQTFIGGTTDTAGVAVGGAGGTARSFTNFDSTEQTTILIDVPA